VSTSSTASRSYTAHEGLARLIAGNERFVRGEARFPTVKKEILAQLATGQRPYATIIGCSDSRVPPELVFDAGFGELFIVRVAGNIICSRDHGHAAICGRASSYAAVRRAWSRGVRRRASRGDDEVAWRARARSHCPPARQHLARTAGPGSGALSGPTGRRGREANVRWSMRQLVETPEGQARLAEGVHKLVGAVFELKTGRVRFLP
jgi:carbonic anhydrase